MRRVAYGTAYLVACGVALAMAACGKNTARGENPTPAPNDAAPSSTLAVIPVRVTYVLRTLVPSLDSIFPQSDSLNAPQCNAVAGLVCHQYVYKREALQLRAAGTQLFIDTRMQYRAKVGVLGSTRLAGCGYPPEPMRHASLSMSTSLYWRRDWRIGARDSKLNASLIDACRVTLVGVNASGTLRDLVDRQLADFAIQADTAIPRATDLKPLADSLWRSFLEPTALDSTGSLWLMLEPEAIRVTPFVGSGPSITTSLVLYARPHVIAGARPVAKVRALPVVALGTAPPAFSVPVTVELPYVDIARRATALLSAETATSGVHVDSVRVRGHLDSVAVELSVSGSMRGTLSLASRLRWDAAARELRLDDLEWTLDSRGMLSRVKATLGAPLVGRAVRRATMGGRIALGAQLDSVRTELMRKLNGPIGPHAVMGSSVTNLQILGVTSTATAFVVSARLSGSAGVWFQ
jgi:hypothetical protein